MPAVPSVSDSSSIRAKRRFSLSWPSRARGNHNVKVVPRPGSLSSSMRPPCSCTMRATIDSPKPVPLPTVAFMIIVGQVVLLGLSSNVVAKSLMTDSVLFIMGSLMLAVAIVKQKLDKRIAWAIVRITGTKTMWIAFGISVASGILASFVGEHTVAAMMLPVGMTLITLTSDDPKKVKNLVFYQLC